jgi:hypothetical protein
VRKEETRERRGRPKDERIKMMEYSQIYDDFGVKAMQN